MATQIQLRRDTASNWAAVNPVLAQGEMGIETDTLKLKIGNGVTAWTSLAYYATTSPNHVLKAGDTMTGPLLLPDGSGAAPALSFASDTNTGFYWPGADQLVLVAGGVTRMHFLGGDLYFSSVVDFNDYIVARPKLKDYSEEQTTPASAAGALTLDLATGNVFEVTLTEATTISFSNPPATGDAGSFTLILKQDATGGRAVTWPASVDWPGGVAPALTTTASAVDILTFVTTDAGTRWYGNLVGAAYA